MPDVRSRRLVWRRLRGRWTERRETPPQAALLASRRLAKLTPRAMMTTMDVERVSRRGKIAPPFHPRNTVIMTCSSSQALSRVTGEGLEPSTNGLTYLIGFHRPS